MWIAPENPYFSKIELGDYVDHSQHFVPPEIDPGAYSMKRSGQSVNFEARINVLNNRNNQEAAMRVARSVRQMPNPFSGAGIRAASYQIEQSLEIELGLAGLWNIAQVPTGSTIVLPLEKTQPPSSYFHPAKFVLSDNACAFRISGDSHTKIGVSREVATGRSASFLRCGGELSVIFRQFPVIEDGFYCDVPTQNAPYDQVLQAWDGLGFGELEYHSTAVNNQAGPSVTQDNSVMHGLIGNEPEIIKIASDMLQLPITELRNLLA